MDEITLKIEGGANHAFSSNEGCVFEEISTTHYVDDSYYEEKDAFLNLRR